MTRRQADGSAGSPRWFDEHLGGVLGIGLPVGAAVATTVLPVARVVELGSPAVAICVAALLLHRRGDPAYLEFVMWLWVLTPWLRRVVDEASGFSEQSPLLLTAPLASLAALLPGLADRRHLPADVSRAFLVALVALLYAFVGGVVRYGPAPAALGLVTWLAPLSVGLWVATAPIDPRALHRVIARLTVLVSLVVGAYGVYQFFLLPAWDATWMRNVPLISIGRPEPYQVRVFSTLNSPATLGTFLGAFLVLLTAAKGRLRWAAAALGFACFGLSLVRTAWLGMAVAFIALLVSGQGRAVRNALLVIAVPAVLLLSFGGPAQDAVAERFNDTVEDGEEDSSFEDRLLFNQRVLPSAMGDVLGKGLGSSSAAVALLDDDEQTEAFATLDSGVLETLISMGSVVGLAFLAVVVAATAGAWRRGRHGSPLEQAAGVAVVALVAQLLLASVLIGATGAAFWVLIGFLARESSPGAAGGDERRRSALSAVA